VWFQPLSRAAYHLFCSQYCGTYHARMVGTVVVMEKRGVQRGWPRAATLHGRRGPQALPETPVRHLPQRRRQARAPVLEASTGTRCGCRRRHGPGGRDYLRESILRRRKVCGVSADHALLQGPGDERRFSGCWPSSERWSGQTPPRTRTPNRPRRPSPKGSLAQGAERETTVSTATLPLAPGEPPPDQPRPAPARQLPHRQLRWRSWLFTTDHKRIGILYLISITLMFLPRGAAILVVRLELITPERPGGPRHLQQAVSHARSDHGVFSS